MTKPDVDRCPQLDEANLDPAQQEVFDAIRRGPRGKVEGPLRIWLQSPELAQRAQALGEFCRFGTSLPARLSELAILVTGAIWKSGFEWAVHAPIAQRSGLEPSVIEAIRTGRTPDFTHDDEAAVYAFSREMSVSRRVSDETFAAALAQIGQTGTVELVGLLGYYTLISMTINAFEVPLPPESANPFPDSP